LRPLLELSQSGKRSLLVLFLCTIVGLQLGLSQAQEPSDLSTRSLKEVKGMAKNALRLGDTYTALRYYEEWSTRKPEQVELAFQLAELHRLTRNYSRAEKAYAQVMKLDIADYPLSVYYLAQMQMSQGKYIVAKENFESFKKNWAKRLADPTYKRLARTASMGCDYALSLKDSTVMAAVQLLDTSINRPHIEFSPIILDEDHIIYGSLRIDSLNLYAIEDIDSFKVPMRKFYTAERAAGKWMDTGELIGPINQADSHIGNGVIREDGSRIYFTRCAKDWKGTVICDLYYADKDGNGWMPAVRMNDLVNMPNFTTTQPAIGRESKKNQEVIYFASDRPGGKGGMDIWYTEFRERQGEFREPRNAGSKVNTVGTEFTPYYSMSNHKLYFSSDGWPGIGGLDVFASEGEKSQFQPAIHQQSEINSPADDLDFTLFKDLRGGFLVSNRNGGISLLHETCCDDIYAFAYSAFIDIEIDIEAYDDALKLHDYLMRIYIKDDSKIVLEDEASPGFMTQEIKVENGVANFSLPQGHTYILEAVKPGYLNSRLEVSTKQIKESEQLSLKFELNPLSTSPKTLPGILYEFNSAELTSEAKLSLDTTLFEILIQNPSIVIEIASHTDSKGLDDYNMRLSDRRARSVVNYLNIKGINRDRMRPKGYGESVPIADNEHEDGSDNPEGRRLNRRTEFAVIGTFEWGDQEEDEKPKEQGAPAGGIKF
jgi:OOP family OmpA-OmpF porin